MKFLCDRCKTRYSIGDDRVRGKILKIRCKNCANVITVREGMPDPEAAPAPAAGEPRAAKRTTLAPA
ncbi:MAG: zinc-ribbon domain-containing protein, partial [Deltaproteobacteria bacterium]|nr:zinc-ribbon domain-containing protein [Deltaproteobacteria bacterium]